MCVPGDCSNTTYATTGTYYGTLVCVVNLSLSKTGRRGFEGRGTSSSTAAQEHTRTDVHSDTPTDVAKHHDSPVVSFVT